MSFYDAVTAVQLKEFFTRLSREYRRPARLLLVGGTSLLLDGTKRATKDIDIVVVLPQPEDGRFNQVLQRLRHQMNIAIEEVSPADFIPLPRLRTLHETPPVDRRRMARGSRQGFGILGVDQ